MPDNPDVIRFFRTKELAEVEFFSAEICEHQFAPHAHDHYAVALTLDGTFHLERGTHAQVLRAGAVVCVPPGEVHGGHRVGARRCKYRMFYIDRAFVERTNNIPALTSEPIYCPRLFGDLLDLHRTCERGSGDRTRHGLVRLLKQLETQRQHVADVSDDPTVLDAVLALMNGDGDETRTMSVGDLAALAGLHPAYFSRLFTARLGLPPHAYRIDRKVQQARWRISSGEPLAEVASDLGFTDQSHLNRHFKRRFGLAPGAYARQVRG
ncbi:MAG: AraC family transcriptional regulator [Pseudomonadota bacterium]